MVRQGKFVVFKCLLLFLVSNIVYSCPKENGFCVDQNGKDQNNGVNKLNAVPGNNLGIERACLALCHAYEGATGCERIFSGGNAGCHVHTKEIEKGNDRMGHACWIFAKCTGKSY